LLRFFGHRKALALFQWRRFRSSIGAGITASLAKISALCQKFYLEAEKKYKKIVAYSLIHTGLGRPADLGWSDFVGKKRAQRIVPGASEKRSVHFMFLQKQNGTSVR
jgi:hypothetical protein